MVYEEAEFFAAVVWWRDALGWTEIGVGVGAWIGIDVGAGVFGQRMIFLEI